MNNFDEKCDNDGRKVMGKKIRLAVFGQKRWLREGGVEIVVKELCTRMVQQGCQVTCYNRSGHHVSGSEYDCVDKTEYKGISLKYVPTIEKKGARDIIGLVLCQDLVQVKMRNFSHFNPLEAQPQCVFFHTIVRIHLVTYSYNGYEFVSYCRKLPDIRKSSSMPACNREF